MNILNKCREYKLNIQKSMALLCVQGTFKTGIKKIIALIIPLKEIKSLRIILIKYCKIFVLKQDY